MKLLTKLKHIFIGWKNWLFPKQIPKPIKRIFDSRMSVCKSNACGKYTLGLCTACGCPTTAKTKVLSELCPENMWEPFVYEYNNTQFIRLNECGTYLLNKFLTSDKLTDYVNNYVHWMPTDGVLLDDWLDFLSDLDSNLDKSRVK